MKKLLYLTVLTLAFLCSCRTALEVPVVQKDTSIQESEKLMEFIGFKNVPKRHAMFQGFGAELERRQIALNREDFYLGVYSLQELEVYKSEMRYVTFVDVVQFKYTYNDGIGDRDNLANAGWIIAGVSCFTLLPVYLPMILAGEGNKTEAHLLLDCILHVYDTKKKDIVLSTPIRINEIERYRGQYFYKKTSTTTADDRYRTMMSNTLLHYYKNAYDFVKNTKQ